MTTGSLFLKPFECPGCQRTVFARMDAAGPVACQRCEDAGVTRQIGRSAVDLAFDAGLEAAARYHEALASDRVQSAAHAADVGDFTAERTHRRRAAAHVSAAGRIRALKTGKAS